MILKSNTDMFRSWLILDCHDIYLVVLFVGECGTATKRFPEVVKWTCRNCAGDRAYSQFREPDQPSWTWRTGPLTQLSPLVEEQTSFRRSRQQMFTSQMTAYLFNWPLNANQLYNGAQLMNKVDTGWSSGSFSPCWIHSLAVYWAWVFQNDIFTLNTHCGYLGEYRHLYTRDDIRILVFI